MAVDGGWNEPKAKFATVRKLASMSESDDVTKNWLSF